MNPTQSFYESRIHTEHAVLGRKLRPLCLLDLLALEAIESPFVRGGHVRAHDVAIAVNLLSKPIQKNLSIDADFTAPGFFLKIRAGVSEIFGTLSHDVKKLEDYVGDYMSAAEMWRPNTSGDSTPLGAHWIQTLAAFLLRETNLTQTEIWTHPVGQILWIVAAVEEQTTQSRVKTADDDEAEKIAECESAAIEELRKIEIKTLKEKIANGATGDELADAQRRLQKLLA